MVNSTLDTSDSATLLKQRFQAMGCYFEMWVSADDCDAARLRMTSAWAFVHAVERSLSRFRPDSELSLLNHNAGKKLGVSELLWTVLALAIQAAEKTGGLFDPTVLGAMQKSGYNTSFQDMRGSGVSAGAPCERKVGAWREIERDEKLRTVKLPHNSGIDLGGIAKGWTADPAARILSETGSALVDAGGDIAARGGFPDKNGWIVGVADPFSPSSDITNVSVCDVGIATSGIDYRRWKFVGKEQHHLIDPATGKPAVTDLLTVTVIAPTASEAEVHAKVAMLKGMGNGVHYLEKTPDIEGILVSASGDIQKTSGFINYEK